MNEGGKSNKQALTTAFAYLHKLWKISHVKISKFLANYMCIL